MKRKLLLALAAMLSLAVFAQEETKKSEFKLTGKPIVTLFANYSAGLGSANKVSGFNLDRAYLGYAFRVHPNIGGRVIFDIASSKVSGSDLERIAFLKNAFLSWTPGKFSMDAGLVKTELFALQESFWGYRYIWKSFMDEYKYGSSADMGIILRYKFTDWVRADFTVSNGEGHKRLNKDNKYRFDIGLTFNPIKEITIRTSYANYQSTIEGGKSQETLALFVGYKHKWFSIGAEYNKLWNSDFIDKQDKTGYSIYGHAKFDSKFSAFTRFDKLTSRDHYFSGDQNRFIIGVQYQPIKFLKISPNFQNVNPTSSGQKAASYAFLSAELKF